MGFLPVILFGLAAVAVSASFATPFLAGLLAANEARREAERQYEIAMRHAPEAWVTAQDSTANAPLS